jgi:hypothetical protein
MGDRRARLKIELVGEAEQIVVRSSSIDRIWRAARDPDSRNEGNVYLTVTPNVCYEYRLKREIQRRILLLEAF